MLTTNTDILLKLQSTYEQQLNITPEERAAQLKSVDSEFSKLQASYQQQLNVTPEERAKQLKAIDSKIEKLQENYKRQSKLTPDAADILKFCEEKAVDSEFAKLQASYTQQLAVTPDERAAQLKLQEQVKVKSKLFDSPCPKCCHIPMEDDRITNEDYELCCPKCNTLYKNKRPDLPYKKLVVNEKLNVALEPLETANLVQFMTMRPCT